MNFLTRSAVKLTEKIFTDILNQSFLFVKRGYCLCCAREVTFKANNHWLRDSFFCPNCCSIPRERALMYFLEKRLLGWRTMKIHESSPSNKGASLKLRKEGKYYSASHYFSDDMLGQKIGDFTNQNLEKLTFENSVFDVFITQDVFEHIYNPSLAFSEISRVLKNGGVHIFTVPIINRFKQTERWAQKDDLGNVQFLHDPEIHGSPIDKKGSFVTMHWGFDIVDYIRECSGLSTEICYVDDIEFGIRAEFNEVFISTKIN